MPRPLPFRKTYGDKAYFKLVLRENRQNIGNAMAHIDKNLNTFKEIHTPIHNFDRSVNPNVASQKYSDSGFL